VVRAFDRRGDRAQLDAAVLRDRRHARRQAAGQADDEVLDWRDAVVRGREDLGVVGLEHRLLQMVVLLAEAEEAVHLDLAVDAVLPLGRRPPGELGGLGRALQHLARVEQRLHVDTVGNRGHLAYSPLRFSIFTMEMLDNTLAGTSQDSFPDVASLDAPLT